ncbi:MAG: hypothetical protein RLZZ129_2060 [Verrucomicrobiota bacterium]
MFASISTQIVDFDIYHGLNFRIKTPPQLGCCLPFGDSDAPQAIFVSYQRETVSKRVANWYLMTLGNPLRRVCELQVTDSFSIHCFRPLRLVAYS